MRVVVTGASGFVGQALGRRLRALGHEMVAVSRSAATTGASGSFRWSGVTDLPVLRRAVEGVDALVHLAARVHVMREHARDPLAAFRAVNVEGARSAARAVLEQQVPRAVLMSTIKVLGENRPEPYTDRDVPSPVDPYAMSKREAESVIGDGPGGDRWTILRPALVYGPGVGGNFARLLRLGVDRAGTPLPLGRATGRRSLVYVDNLADAVIAALCTPGTRGHAYVIADDEQPTAAELLRALAALGGEKARLLPVPGWFLGLAAAAIGRRAEIERLVGSLTADASAFRQAAGWIQGVSLEEGLERTVAWWTTRSA